MYDFYLYSGKQENGDTPYKDLQKSAQVVAKLCTDLPGNLGHKVFFDNWFTTLELMLYLKRRGILAVGTVRANRLQGCPLLERQDRGSMDYRSDSNSAIIIIKWLDNSVVQLTSNYVGINPLGTIERWVKKDGERKEIPCPQIVKAYNKSMGGVDLADMLIALYRIEVKTKRWYIKVFWHLVDIAKLNAWILYKSHYKQYGYPLKKMKSLVVFSKELADSLIHANKGATAGNGREGPSKIN